MKIKKLIDRLMLTEKARRRCEQKKSKHIEELEEKLRVLPDIQEIKTLAEDIQKTYVAGKNTNYIKDYVRKTIRATFSDKEIHIGKSNKYQMTDYGKDKHSLKKFWNAEKYVLNNLKTIDKERWDILLTLYDALREIYDNEPFYGTTTSTENNATNAYTIDAKYRNGCLYEIKLPNLNRQVRMFKKEFEEKYIGNKKRSLAVVSEIIVNYDGSITLYNKTEKINADYRNLTVFIDITNKIKDLGYKELYILKSISDILIPVLKTFKREQDRIYSQHRKIINEINKKAGHYLIIEKI